MTIGIMDDVVPPSALSNAIIPACIDNGLLIGLTFPDPHVAARSLRKRPSGSPCTDASGARHAKALKRNHHARPERPGSMRAALPWCRSR